MKLGAARDQSRIAWRLAVIEVAADSATFSYRLDRNKLRQARSREGRYLFARQPRRGRPRRALEPFSAAGQRSRRRSRTSKATSRSGRCFADSRRASRPTSSSPSSGLLPARHPCAAFACSGAGADAAQRIERLAAVQMIDVHLPTTDGRELVLTRWCRARTRAQPLAERVLKLDLPAPNHHPKSTAPPARPRHPPRCRADLRGSASAMSDT